MSSIAPSSDETAIASVEAEAPRIAGYRALWRLGAGASGEVWAVEREPSGPIRAPLALKRLHPTLAEDRGLIARFLDEMRLASRITHPAVCRIADGGMSDGVPYIVMELLVGLTLAEVEAHVRASVSEEIHERWPWVLACVLAQACEGLHAAHELDDEKGAPLGLVHRDVSPDNLMICFDGTARVIDFGIAAARRARERTASGELHAKLAYASPEQVEGSPIDRRTDVWALGVVLWEGVAGAALFERSTLLETVEAIGRAAVPPMSERTPHAPIALEEIAARALARDPARRFATARAMGRELRVALAERGAIDAAEVASFLADLMPGVGLRLQRLGTRPRAAHPQAVAPSRRAGARVVQLAIALASGIGLGWLLARVC